MKLDSPVLPHTITSTEAYNKIVAFLSRNDAALGDDLSLTLNIPTVDELEDILSKLEPQNPRYSYNHSTGAFTIFEPPSPIHESTLSLIASIMAETQSLISENSSGTFPAVRSFGRASRDLVNPEDPTELITKCPDGGLQVDSSGTNLEGGGISLPQLILETGYSKSYEDLKRTARLWLTGSQEGDRKIQCVLLFSFTKPVSQEHLGDITKWKGFLEFWVRKGGQSNRGIPETVGSDTKSSYPVQGPDLAQREVHVDSAKVEQEDTVDGLTSSNEKDKPSCNDETVESAGDGNNDEYHDIVRLSDPGRVVGLILFVFGIPLLRLGSVRLRDLLPPFNTSTKVGQDAPADDLAFTLRIADIFGGALPTIAHKTIKIRLTTFLFAVKVAIADMVKNAAKVSAN